MATLDDELRPVLWRFSQPVRLNEVEGEAQGLQRILVFRIGHLGDTLVALPAFRALRASFPRAHIALLTNTSIQNPHYIGAQSAVPEGLFDEYIHYPADAGKTAPVFGKLLLQLRQKQFDAVVYLMTRNRSPRQVMRDRLFFRLAGIKRSYGDAHLLENRLDFEMERPLPKVRSEAGFLLDCLERDGLVASGGQSPEPEGIFAESDLAAADRWLSDNCAEAFRSGNLVAVAPGSKWESKVWAEERYASLVSQLIEKAGIFPVVFGGAEDAEKGERLLARWGTGANAAGRFSVKESAAALSRCRMLLGNDTGTMHLAAASGTKCVAVFAAVDFEGRWHPVGEGHVVFRAKVPCEGCSSPNCANARLCLDLIEEDPVLEACLKMLGGHLSAAAR